MDPNCQYQGMIPLNMGMPLMNLAEQMGGLAQYNFPMAPQLLSVMPSPGWPSYSETEAYNTTNQNQVLGPSTLMPLQGSEGVSSLSLPSGDSDFRLALCGQGSDRVPLVSDFDLRGPSLRKSPDRNSQVVQDGDRTLRNEKDNNPVSSRMISHHQDARGKAVSDSYLSRSEISPVPDRRVRESSPVISDRRHRHKSPDHLVSDRRHRHKSPDHLVSDRRHRHKSPDHLASDRRHRHKSPDHLASDRRHRHKSPDHLASDRRHRHKSPDHLASDRRLREVSPKHSISRRRHKERSPSYPSEKKHRGRTPTSPSSDRYKKRYSHHHTSDRKHRESSTHSTSDRKHRESSTHYSNSDRRHKKRCANHYTSDRRHRETTSDRRKERSPASPAVHSQHRERSPIHSASDRRYRGRSPIHPASDSRYKEKSPIHPASDSKYKERSPIHPASESRCRERSPVHSSSGSQYRERSPILPASSSQFRERSPIHSASSSQHRERSPNYPSHKKHKDSSTDYPVPDGSPNYPTPDRIYKSSIPDYQHLDDKINSHSDKNLIDASLKYEQGAHESSKYDRRPEGHPKHEDNVVNSNNYNESGYIEHSLSKRRERSISRDSHSSRQSDNYSDPWDQYDPTSFIEEEGTKAQNRVDHPDSQGDGIGAISTSNEQDLFNKSMDKEYEQMKYKGVVNSFTNADQWKEYEQMKNKGVVNNFTNADQWKREERHKSEKGEGLISGSTVTPQVEPSGGLASFSTSLITQWGGFNSSQQLNPQNAMNQQSTGGFPPSFSTKEIMNCLGPKISQTSTSTNQNFKSDPQIKTTPTPTVAGSSFLDDSSINEFQCEDSECKSEEDNSEGSVFKNNLVAAIFPVKPNLTLERYDIIPMRRMLIDLIHDIAKKHDEGIKQPQLRFKSSGVLYGHSFKIQCADKFTHDWMLSWKPPVYRGMELMVRQTLKSIFRIGIFYHNEKSVDVELALKQLCAQNNGLDTSLWRCLTHHVDPMGKGVFLVFDIDSASMKFIQDMNYTLYYHLSTLKVKPLEKWYKQQRKSKQNVVHMMKVTRLKKKVQNMFAAFNLSS